MEPVYAFVASTLNTNKTIRNWYFTFVSRYWSMEPFKISTSSVSKPNLSENILLFCKWSSQFVIILNYSWVYLEVVPYKYFLLFDFNSILLPRTLFDVTMSSANIHWVL